MHIDITLYICKCNFILEETFVMYHKDYSNFVRPIDRAKVPHISSLRGDEARKLYLQEVGHLLSPQRLKETSKNTKLAKKNLPKKKSDESQLSSLQLFKSVQNNDFNKLRQYLDTYPEKINTVDEFGWSLLMIACQANAIETVKELLKRGINTSIRDKAGNSAQSLVIRNRNISLANIFSEYNKSTGEQNKTPTDKQYKNKSLKERYKCEICDNNFYEDKQEHLSSTIHNINASKGKKIPVSYGIPESNKGFQLMLQFGWNKEDGLGPNGSGNRYPIRTIKKNDRNGLGLKKNKQIVNVKEELQRQKSKYKWKSDSDNNRQMEINFRRQFY